MSGDAPLVRLVGVTKRIGGEPVLRGVSLDVYPGEFLVVRGRSGVGKTTLLRIMALLEEPDSGLVEVLGLNASLATDREKALLRLRHIGIVHQFFDLIPSLTALENVELPLALAGVPREERERRCMRALAAVGLEDKASKFPPELSGGERQRVAIARAIVTEPRLLLADEPLSNLDDETAERVLDLFRGLCARGAGVVMTTTDLYSPLPSSREYLLLNGRLRPLRGE